MSLLFAIDVYIYNQKRSRIGGTTLKVSAEVKQSDADGWMAVNKTSFVVVDPILTSSLSHRLDSIHNCKTTA